MNAIIAFIPALGWGFMPIVAHLTKGSPREQLTGTAFGAVLFALCLYGYSPTSLQPISFIVSFASGVCWSAGQGLQFQAFQRVSVSKAVPVICGLQLTGTTLFAAFILGEWNTSFQFIIGLLGLCCILTGVALMSFRKKSGDLSGNLPPQLVIILACSSLALTLYVVINQVFQVSGLSVILPQSLGMLCSALLINAMGKKPLRPFQIASNLSTGLIWSVANLALFISNGLIGVAASFPISQVSIAISCIGSILVFREKISSRQWLVILTGVTMMLLGVGLISLLKK
ncbi:GRP family sugar transporter [Paenibacillus sp. J22TS3]|uniref:GRP family sugar transporter n=1 Tax=Paenibacillus sp. J22TS3 TaxID=2807192 RepID=UPI001BCEC495|nr:GRP family sugar transporter [Paenibacillus sp. J22TS3]